MFIGELIWSFPFYLSSFFPKSAGTIPRSLAQCGTVCNNNRLLEMSLWFPPCFQNVHFSLEMKTINHLNGQRGLKWGTMVECQLNCYCWLPLLETLWIVFWGGGRKLPSGGVSNFISYQKDENILMLVPGTCRYPKKKKDARRATFTLKILMNRKHTIRSLQENVAIFHSTMSYENIS